MAEWTYAGERLVPLKGFPGVVWERTQAEEARGNGASLDDPRAGGGKVHLVRPAGLGLRAGRGATGVVRPSYGIEEVDDLFESAAARERLRAINPVAQLPTLVTPDGSVMTESAAITLHLAEVTGDDSLVPSVGRNGAAEVPAVARVPGRQYLSDLHLRR